MLFGCVDGPELMVTKVDFEELIKRQRMMLPEERLTSECVGDRRVRMWQKQNLNLRLRKKPSRCLSRNLHS